MNHSAYELYANYEQYANYEPGNVPKTDRLAPTFKNTFSRKDVRVHFIGVWYVHTLILSVYAV